jgi:hypothetical protein
MFVYNFLFEILVAAKSESTTYNQSQRSSLREPDPGAEVEIVLAASEPEIQQPTANWRIWNCN